MPRRAVPRPLEPMTSHAAVCPFCSPASSNLVAQSSLSLALRDAHPVSPGHTLVVPRRHVESVFDLSDDEWADLWALVRRICGEVDELRAADALNIGVNDGPAAGQTVLHAHIHVIPRRHGDVSEPRGGVRWVIAARADYWSGSGHTRG